MDPETIKTAFPWLSASSHRRHQKGSRTILYSNSDSDSADSDSDADSDGDSDGLYYSEPDSGAPARRLFHSVHGANQFTPGGTLVSVQPSGTPSEAQISGSDGTLIPTGQSKRRRHRVRRLSSGKLVRLGSEVSLKALSLVNPVNIANAVSSTQAPNLRRHAVLAEKLERVRSGGPEDPWLLARLIEVYDRLGEESRVASLVNSLASSVLAVIVCRIITSTSSRSLRISCMNASTTSSI